MLTIPPASDKDGVLFAANLASHCAHAGSTARAPRQRRQRDPRFITGVRRRMQLLHNGGIEAPRALVLVIGIAGGDGASGACARDGLGGSAFKGVDGRGSLPFMTPDVSYKCITV